jgi:vacuolar-type H+-ATPase subunit H
MDGARFDAEETERVQEQLRMILEAEAEARQQLDAAHQEGKLLVERAEEEARRCLREAREARETIMRSEEERLLAEAEERARRVEEKARARAAATQSLAKTRMERAVEALVASILGGGDSDDW